VINLSAANPIVTSNFNKFVSHCIKGNAPNLYFALGTGNPSWDNNDDIPAPDTNISKLVSEIFRQPIYLSDIDYVDESDDSIVSSTPTSRLRIKINVSQSFYGTTREYGIFAINATSDIDSGTLIMYCNHTKLSISSELDYDKYIYINT